VGVAATGQVFKRGRGGYRQGMERTVAYVVAAADAGTRADEYLEHRAPVPSRAFLRRTIQGGGARVNGHRMASSTRLREGDTVVVSWRTRDYEPAALGPRILYRDEHLLALDKPAGMLVHPVGRGAEATLIDVVREALRPVLAESNGLSPGLVNRLDQRTSGIVLVAWNPATLASLHRLIGGGGVEKKYVALVAGEMEADVGAVVAPIGKARASAVAIRRAVRGDGQEAVTLYAVRERLAGATLLDVRPLTGRQHQIRVHLAAVGHPVWGDLIYADEALFLRSHAADTGGGPPLPARHALHAAAVRFRHPVTGVVVEIESPIPPDFAWILQGLRPGTPPRGEGCLQRKRQTAD
jgi:RluA family pseudouridine synthase